MKYKLVKRAKFIDRPNRFIARVLIDGRPEKVHVRNTGRCRELLVPHAQLILEDCKDRKERKTRYSLVSVYKGSRLINMDSQIPNQLVYQAIADGRIPEIGQPQLLKREVGYNKSRFDIYFEKDGRKNFLEVKGVTLEKDGLALFPDAPSLRASKHIHHLIDSLDEGYGAYIFFLIQMKGPKLFMPNSQMDPEFAQALKLAQAKGVKILVYDSIVGPDSISLGSRVDFDLGG